VRKRERQRERGGVYVCKLVCGCLSVFFVCQRQREDGERGKVEACVATSPVAERERECVCVYMWACLCVEIETKREGERMGISGDLLPSTHTLDSHTHLTHTLTH